MTDTEAARVEFRLSICLVVLLVVTVLALERSWPVPVFTVAMVGSCGLGLTLFVRDRRGEKWRAAQLQRFCAERSWQYIGKDKSLQERWAEDFQLFKGWGSQVSIKHLIAVSDGDTVVTFGDLKKRLWGDGSGVDEFSVAVLELPADLPPVLVWPRKKAGRAAKRRAAVNTPPGLTVEFDAGFRVRGEASCLQSLLEAPMQRLLLSRPFVGMGFSGRRVLLVHSDVDWSIDQYQPAYAFLKRVVANIPDHYLTLAPERDG